MSWLGFELSLKGCHFIINFIVFGVRITAPGLVEEVRNGQFTQKSTFRKSTCQKPQLGAYVMKLLRSQFTNIRTMLECLALASLSKLG
jgi:hypothetical protein